MKEALWRRIEDKIRDKIVQRKPEKSEPLRYSWLDIEYAIQLTIKEMRKK